MASNKEDFRQEVARITGEDDDYAVDYDGLDDPATVDALEAFADALNPERARPRLRKPKADGTLTEADVNFGTGAAYLKALRLTYRRGFDLLDGAADEYNDFILDMVDGELPDYNGSIQRTTAGKYQSAARGFYRFCTEPGKSDGRPDTSIEWPADDIYVFADQSEPRYDKSDMFDDAEVDALREGCLKGQNPRRDRALVELLAGTCQRLEAIRTLRIRDVELDPDEGPPYMLINPEIKNEGDKGAIETAGRWRPIVSDVGPVREYISNHPLADEGTRDEHACPDALGDCYLFVGDPSHPTSDPSSGWDGDSIRERLSRLAKTASVHKPVKPHNFRHWAYSKSKELSMDEDMRGMVFGWEPGSDTGQTTYGHVEGESVGIQFAEKWAETFDESDGDDVTGVTEQVVGDAFGGDLPPEAEKAIARELVSNEEFVDAVADAVLETSG